MAIFARSLKLFFARWRAFFGVFLTIAFVIAMATLFALQSKRLYEQQARISADNLAQVLGGHIAGFIDKVNLSLRTVALEAVADHPQGEISATNLNRLLAQQKRLLPDVTDLIATDANGFFKYGPNPLVELPRSLSDTEYFRHLRDEPTAELVVSGPYQGRGTLGRIMVFARRLVHPDGSFAGIVAATINLESIERLLGLLDLGHSGCAVLRTADMHLIARFPSLENRAKGPYNSPPPIEYLESVVRNPVDGTFIATNPTDQVQRRIAYRKLGDAPLYIAVGLARKDYLDPWHSQVTELAGLVTIFILVAVWLSRKSIRSADIARTTDQLLHEALEYSAAGLSIFDKQQRLVLCNETSQAFFPEIRDVSSPGIKFEHIVRTGVLRGNYPEAQENPEDWIRRRIDFHLKADGQPFEQRLSDGRHLLIVEKRTPSGHVISSRIDITELQKYRHQLERLVEIRTAELQTALDQFRILVELSPTALAMLDRNLNYLAVSRRWVELYGKGHCHLVGRHIYDIAPDLPEHWKAVHRAALGGVMDSRDEDLWVKADGSEHWLRWVVHPWMDGSGHGGIIISTEDITDRKRIERQLLEREAHFRASFEQAGVGLCHVTLTGLFLEVNDKYCTILGYEREELLSLRFQDITHPADIAITADSRAQLLAGTIRSFTREKRYLRKDGSAIWVNLTSALVRKANGEPDYFLAVVEDIQQKKNTEQALAAEREYRHFLLEQEFAKRTTELQAANRQLERLI